MKSGKWKLALILTLVAVVVVLYLSISAIRTIRSTQSSQPAGQSGRAATGQEARASESSPGAFLGSGSESGEAGQFGRRVIEGLPRPGGLVLTAARDYRLRARYPESTNPLQGTHDPIESERTPSPKRQAGPGGEDPALTAYPSRVSYESPEPVVIYAFFSRNEERVAADELVLKVVHEVEGEVAQIELNDDGLEGDQAAGDLVFTALFQPSESGSYLAAVRGRSSDQQERAVSTGFLYSRPDARPTGRFRDRLVEGNLQIDVEIEVSRRGRFHVEGTLFSLEGEAIGWAQAADRFESGSYWFPLTFYGLVFHEKGVDGPYLLRSLALSTVTEMPNQKNRVLREAHLSKAYRVDQFTAEPFNDPALLEAAARLEM